MDGAHPPVVSKSEFARLLNVTPGRVSQYLAAGQIFGPAILGEGRNARIIVRIAREQLRRRLDPSHRIGSGLATRLDSSGPAVAPLAPTESPAAAPTAQNASPALPIVAEEPLGGGDIADRIQLERLRAIRAANRRQEEEELKRRGQLAPAAEVKAALHKVAGRILAIVEGGFAAIAAQAAAKLQVPQRDLLHEIKVEWRKVRQAAEAELRQQIEALPTTVSPDPKQMNGASRSEP